MLVVRAVPRDLGNLAPSPRCFFGSLRESGRPVALSGPPGGSGQTPGGGPKDRREGISGSEERD
eukprot:1519118-Pyramimonas_sp.AAC.1